MATATVFGSLSVPVPDDTMEVSSPANRNPDDDIDIDFEDYQGGVQLPDDDQMLEDIDPTRPTTATDDMMEDDLLPDEQIHVEEEIMQDDGPQVQETHQEEDEELIDYSEDEFEEQAAREAVIPPVNEEPPEFVDTGSEQGNDNVTYITKDATVEVPPTALGEEVTAEAAQAAQLATSAEGFLVSNMSAQDGVNDEAGSALAGETHTDEDARNAEDPSLAQPSTYEEDPKAAPISVDTNITAPADTPDTPTDTGLHPMTFRYAGLSMPLFKSRRQPEGLLKDDNLASLSLAELIQSCRQQLALKIGEDVSEDQEVLLGFGHLGLMLVEDCRAAFESSLNDVLEVYLQLHQNDGAQEIPPLSLSLSLQLKFQSSFTILKQAAAGGQGMSSFGFLQSTGEDSAEYYQEEFDDGEATGLQGPGHVEEGFEDHEYDESTYVEHADGAAHEDLGEDSHGLKEAANQANEDDHDDYYQDEGGYHGDLAEDTSHLQEPDEATARLEELQTDQGLTEDALYNAPEDPEEIGQIPAIRGRNGPAGDGQGTKQLAESTASSTTVQGDSANNTTTGEYDEDFIDWDDDTLTCAFSEHPGDAHNDFSTFLEEYDENEPKLALPTGDREEVGDATAPPEDPGVPEANDQAFNAQNFGSEDFLNDFTGQDYGEEVQQGEQDYLEEYGADDQAEQEEYHDYDQADTYDEQQEQYHTDYQPGEDEQFLAAQDFLDNNHYEHGLEHDLHAEGDDFDDTVGTVIHHEIGDLSEEDGQENFGDDEPTGEHHYDGLSHRKSTKGSPLGKRSFDELAELDELEDDARELKKARPS